MATVAVFQRIGFGAVLGYLVAGILVGPFSLEPVTDTETISVLGEYGVVFLLFIIGLELPLERIRVMRVPIFGLGLTQGNRVNGSLCDEACAEVVVPGGDLSAES